MFEFVRQWMRRWLGIEAIEKEARATERYVSKELRTLETWADMFRDDLTAVDERRVALATSVNVEREKLANLLDRYEATVRLATKDREDLGYTNESLSVLWRDVIERTEHLRPEVEVFKGKVEDLDDEMGMVRDEIQGIRDSQAHLMHRVERVQDKVFPKMEPPSEFTREISELIISSYGPGEDFNEKDLLPKTKAARAKARAALKELVERGLLSKVSTGVYRREV